VAISIAVASWIFYRKSLSFLKPGGVLALITSRYTLDKRKSVARRHLAKHAELLAAVRLPSGAFKQNAGTEVIADVIILRKRASPIDLDHSEAPVWVEVGTQRLFDEYGGEAELPINKLFIARPDLMLGKPKLDRGMYSRSELVIEPEVGDLAVSLRDRLIFQFPTEPLSAPVAVGQATINQTWATSPAPNQTESPPPPGSRCEKQRHALSGERPVRTLSSSQTCHPPSGRRC